VFPCASKRWCHRRELQISAELLSRFESTYSSVQSTQKPMNLAHLFISVERNLPLQSETCGVHDIRVHIMIRPWKISTTKTHFPQLSTAHRYPDCPTSASLYSSVEATPNAWRARANTAKESETHITNVGWLKELREGKKGKNECYSDIVRYCYIEKRATADVERPLHWGNEEGALDYRQSLQMHITIARALP
jgi:hypothetical protein